MDPRADLPCSQSKKERLSIMSRRKTGTLSGIFNSLLKMDKDYKNGVLHNYSCGYIFSDKGCTNNQGVYIGPCELEDGRKTSLVIEKYVSNCPKPPKENCVPGYKKDEDNQYFWVPKKDCLKCSNHIRHTYTKRSKNMCRVLRDMANPYKVGSSITKVLSSVSEKINELQSQHNH